MLLVGDIGGTKTNLAIVSTAGKVKLENETTFKSGDFPSLEAIVQKFLAGTGVTITQAVFGVAGPVVNGQSKITNLPWLIAETTLSQTLALPEGAVKLLNDLESIAYAVPHLGPEDLTMLNDVPVPAGSTDGHKAVIAPGTGLGEAVLFYDKGRYYVLASEGGHADFAPTSLFQMGLLRYMLGKFHHVSYERVCSGGLGIPNIYAFLKESRPTEVTAQVEEALQAAADPTPIIINAAVSGNCELCRATLNAFVSILGAEAGNLALKVMATGGVYLAGGIPPKLATKLKDGTFMAAFVNKGRFAELLARIPVCVILNEKTGLLGAAHYGLNA